MEDYEFTLVIDQRLTDDEIDALFDAGADDQTPERSQARTLLHFDRATDTLPHALVSALVDVERAGLTVSAIRTDDLVTPREIAARTRRSYEGVRLLAAGKRGPGGFPAPLQSEGWTLYSWSQVRDWFAHHPPGSARDAEDPSLEFDRVIAAADHLVRARALMRGVDLANGLDALLVA